MSERLGIPLPVQKRAGAGRRDGPRLNRPEVVGQGGADEWVDLGEVASGVGAERTRETTDLKRHRPCKIGPPQECLLHAALDVSIVGRRAAIRPELHQAVDTITHENIGEEAQPVGDQVLAGSVHPR